MTKIQHQVIFIIGVSGAGKSTIGKRVADELKIPFFDGDDFHSEANRKKMASGTPLNDIDRKGWLRSLNELAKREVQNHSLVIACSALKEKYRQQLMTTLETQCRWYLLEGTYELILNRMNKREEHYMPSTLLQSQFDTLEVPGYAVHVDIHLPVIEIVNLICDSTRETKSALGIVGLGVMGSSLARNFAKRGFKLSLFNQRVDNVEEDVAKKLISSHSELKGAVGFEDLEKFVKSIKAPRTIVCMIPAGSPVDLVIERILPYLSAGDVLMDCGNSHFRDTEYRQQLLQDKHVNYLGVGISGGEEGALNGPSIMVGGSSRGYDKVKFMVEAIAAIDKEGNPCCARVGEGGSGHFVKMVHNGIEYAEMQLLAEVYGVLRWVAKMSPDKIAVVFEDWMGTDVNSYLLTISVDILRKKENDNWLIDSILDVMGNKGTGGWTTMAAAELGVPIPTLTEALFSRYISSFKSFREQLGGSIGFTVGSSQVSIENLLKTYRLARICIQQQGFQLIEEASHRNKWGINLSTVARIWTNGCIIRSTLMETLEVSFAKSNYVLSDVSIQKVISKEKDSAISMVGDLIKANVPIPVMASALIYLQSISRAESYGNFIQAQRDYFGAHGYQRVDDPIKRNVHTQWKK